MIQFFNTATKKKEEFHPLDPAHIRLYACGPTVYDYIHLGNARPLIIFDVLYRLLKHHYPRVTYIRNITDIDDKINQRATERHISITELTEKMITQFHDDCRALYCLKPDIEPKVTDHIDPICAMITRLIDNGHAYALTQGDGKGHVLFDIDTQSDYGCFSGRDNAQSRDAGARIAPLPYKKNPGDFVLWKPSSGADPGWDSPWGYGRPGWHIECSAMSTHYLGKNFDIHCGGQDLIFPHHQNEIAQSTGAYPKSIFARYWLHNGYITCNGEKMSKSLGNFHTVYDLLKNHHGETLRLMLLQTHYRHPFDFSKHKLDAAAGWLKRFYQIHQEIQDMLGNAQDPHEEEKNTSNAIEDAVKDDLNTPKALASLSAMIEAWRKEKQPALRKNIARQWKSGVRLLGLGERKQTKNVSEIEMLIAARDQARATKNFSKADHIRVALSELGVIVEDGPEGTIWKRQIY